MCSKVLVQPWQPREYQVWHISSNCGVLARESSGPSAAFPLPHVADASTFSASKSSVQPWQLREDWIRQISSNRAFHGLSGSGTAQNGSIPAILFSSAAAPGALFQFKAAEVPSPLKRKGVDSILGHKASKADLYSFPSSSVQLLCCALCVLIWFSFLLLLVFLFIEICDVQVCALWNMQQCVPAYRDIGLELSFPHRIPFVSLPSPMLAINVGSSVTLPVTVFKGLSTLHPLLLL